MLPDWQATADVLEKFGDLMIEIAEGPGDGPGFGVDLQYCHAVSHFNAGTCSVAWFSTDDRFMLEYASEIQEEMGLEIVTPEEGVRRLASHQYVVYSGGIGSG